MTHQLRKDQTFYLISLLLLLSSITLSVSGDNSDMTDEFSLQMQIPFSPIPVRGDGVNYIAYELELSDNLSESYHLTRAEAEDMESGTILLSLSGEALNRSYHQASNPPPTSEEMASGTKNLINPRITFWIQTPDDAALDRIIHHLTYSSGIDELSEITFTGGEVEVQNKIPISIRPPLKGSGWLSWETTAPDTHHLLSQITINNTTRVPQRFAQDWMRLNEINFPCQGDCLKNEDWFGYGREVLAVHDGTVVKTMDGIVDNDPVGTNPPFNVSELAGNYVIIEIGEDVFACYGHLIPGSISVSPGDFVQEGDLIGNLGNSGNSDGPHLHFQLANQPDFLAAEGLPFTFWSFNTTGTCDLNLSCSEFDTPRMHTDEIVENHMIVGFPED